MMTVAEVAAFLRVSTRTVWRRLAAGDLPKVYVGTAVRVPQSAVEALAQTKIAA